MTKQELQQKLFEFKKDCELMNTISQKVEKKSKLHPTFQKIANNFDTAIRMTKEVKSENIKNIR